MWWQWYEDTSISPSTAYRGCQTPFICVEWRCKAFHMGLEPQPLHKGFIQHQAVLTRDFSRLPKSGPATVGVNGVMTDPYPHPQHMKDVKVWYMFGVDEGTIPHGFGASTTAKRLHSAPSSDLVSQPTSPICTGNSGGEWHDDRSISPSTANK